MTDRVYSEKNAARNHLIKSLKEELNFLRNIDATGPTPREIDLLTQLKEAMKTPSLTNDDLSSTVCGNPTYEKNC